MQKPNSHLGILSKIAILLIILSLVVACSPSPTPSPTAVPAAPTAPPAPVTPTPEPTVTRVPPTNTPIPPTATPSYTAESALPTRNIVYAKVDGLATRLNVHVPSEAGSWPVVVVVHGWDQGKMTFEKLAGAIASQGAVVYNIDVTFTVPFLPSIERLACAVRFARATASDYDGDPNRITIVGNSAGAAIGAVVSLAGDDFNSDGCVVPEGSALPDVLVAYEGGYEIATTNYGGIIDHTYLKQENPELLESIDPYAHIGGNPDLQVRLIHGEDHNTAWYDLSPEEAIALHQVLADSGYDVELILVEGASHIALTKDTSKAFALTVQQVMELARSSSQ